MYRLEGQNLVSFVIIYFAKFVSLACEEYIFLIIQFNSTANCGASSIKN